jgi:hypothetical protein
MEQTEVVTDELRSFFDRFSYILVTISIQPEVEGSQVPSGKWFSQANRIRAVTLETFYSARFQLELQNANLNGCAIWFMVNEGNGLPAPDAEPGILNCGKRVNVTKFTALTIDTDNADSKQLLAKLTELSLLPHVLTETSPGKYHFYFFLEPEKAEGDSILQFKALQKKLASLVPDLDQSLTDINQVLRVPGFFNLKPGRLPFKVHVLRSGIHALYNLKFTFDRLEAHLFLDSLVKANGNHVSAFTKFEFPTGYLKKGERRKEITRYIEHLMGNRFALDAPEIDYWLAVDGYVHNYIQPSERADFITGGSRRPNIEQYFHDQRARRLKLKLERDTQLALKQFDHITAVEESRLPDEFYLSFPGDLGRVTNEIHAFGPTISLELCFATALCVCGALKAEVFRFEDAWPMVNGIIIAPPGAGKSSLKGAIEKILTEAGLLGRFPQLLDFAKTVQMLHLNLYSAGGVGTTLVDEAGDYISSIKNKNSSSHTQDLKKYYREATTGPSEGVRLTPGGAVASNYPPITNGFLSLWLFIQPDKFKGSLSLDDMSDGFLPRFLVFRGKSSFKFLSKQKNKAFVPSADFKIWIEQYTQLLGNRDLKEVLERIRISVVQGHGRGNPTGAVKEAQREAVYQLRTENRLTRQMIEVKLTDESEVAYNAYMLELQNKVDAILEEKNESDPRLVIFKRAKEMINRLIGCGSPINGVVELDLMEAIIRFHRFDMERFFTGELAAMTQDQDMEDVIKAVKLACKNKNRPVSIGEVVKALSSGYRPRAFEQLLKEAVRQGRVWEDEVPHSRERNRKVLYYRPPVAEEII